MNVAIVSIHTFITVSTSLKSMQAACVLIIGADVVLHYFLARSMSSILTGAVHVLLAISASFEVLQVARVLVISTVGFLRYCLA